MGEWWRTVLGMALGYSLLAVLFAGIAYVASCPLGCS